MPIRNPLVQQTPITIVPPGYQADLDRLPPAGGQSCLRVVGLLLFGLIVLSITIFGVVAFVRSQQPGMTQEAITPIPTRTFAITPLARLSVLDSPRASATPTPTQTATLDSWSATGTALFIATASLTATPSATVDYCAYLTPTATYTATPVYTLDPWQVTGTAVFHLTSTATPAISPTPTTPRAWCDLALRAAGAGQGSATASLTPMPLPGRGTPGTPGAGTASGTPIDPLYLASPTLRATTRPPLPTTTLFPDLPTQPPQPPYNPPTVQPPVVQPTLQPPVVQTVVVVVTEPRSPTDEPTETPEPTETVTSSPTATHTDLTTFTPSHTATDVPTEPPIILPSATATVTATLLPSATPTDLPTATPLPTQAPVLAIVAGDCLQRFPSFTIINFGGVPGDGVNWEILIPAGAAANGRLGQELIPGAYVNLSAPVWAGVPGWYRLVLYQPWDGVTPALMLDVYCEPPTLVPTATLTASPTPTPTQTETPTATPEAL